jgi:ParB-like nuclease domain
MTRFYQPALAEARTTGLRAILQTPSRRSGLHGQSRHCDGRVEAQLFIVRTAKSMRESGMRKLLIDKIKVRDRFRKNPGDVQSLAASIEDVGLLHPIVVRPDGRLIAGERRLAACRKLGWTSVPVTFVDLKELIRGEFAENAERKDLLPSEIDAIRRALLPLETAAAKERQRHHGGTAPGRKKHSGQISRSDGRVRDRIASFAGISGRTLEKSKTIVDAAERQPRRFRSLVAEMDRNGRVDAIYRKLQR